MVLESIVVRFVGLTGSSTMELLLDYLQAFSLIFKMSSLRCERMCWRFFIR